MSPRMYVSASFYTGSLTDEETDALNSELDDEGFLIAREGDDLAVAGNYSEGYVTVLMFLTSSWGESLGIDAFKEEYDAFVSTVTEVCLSRQNYNLPSFKLGSTYW